MFVEGLTSKYVLNPPPVAFSFNVENHDEGPDDLYIPNTPPFAPEESPSVTFPVVDVDVSICKYVGEPDVAVADFTSNVFVFAKNVGLVPLVYINPPPPAFIPPAFVRFPVASILNLELDATSKLSKSPLNVDVALSARYVPVADPTKPFSTAPNPPSPIDINPDDVAADGAPKKLSFPFIVIPPW